jgi:hypothetical protein
MKIWKKLVWGAVLALFINGVAQVYLPSVGQAATENGITINTATDMPRGHYGVECVFFDNYDPGTSTMVYNGAGGTTDTSGKVSVRAYNVSKVFHIQVPKLASTNLHVDIYGQVGTDTGWGLLTQYSTSTASTVGHIINVVDNVDSIRVGLQNTGTDGTDGTTVTATMMGGK